MRSAGPRWVQWRGRARPPIPGASGRDGREIRHEPENTTCGCGTPMQRIGEDVAEKLDYQPGVFTLERHIRGKWMCKCCETITQTPVAPHVIDKGLPTTNLLAQVLVAKYLDHLPLYRQEAMLERAGPNMRPSLRLAHQDHVTVDDPVPDPSRVILFANDVVTLELQRLDAILTCPGQFSALVGADLVEPRGSEPISIDILVLVRPLEDLRDARANGPDGSEGGKRISCHGRLPDR
jgi:transposase